VYVGSQSRNRLEGSTARDGDLELGLGHDRSGQSLEVDRRAHRRTTRGQIREGEAGLVANAQTRGGVHLGEKAAARGRKGRVARRDLEGAGALVKEHDRLESLTCREMNPGGARRALGLSEHRRDIGRAH